MQRLASLLRSPFSFLFSGTSAEDRVAAYVIREHSPGRGLAEILQDRYVQNRLDTQQQRRLLDRPEVVHALGDEAVERPALDRLDEVRGLEPSLLLRVAAHERRPLEDDVVELARAEDVRPARANDGAGSQPLAAEDGIPGGRDRH